MARVRCHARFEHPVPDVPGVIHALTIGHDYVVSSMLVQATGTVLLQVVNDRKRLTWHSSKIFTTVATRIPSNWTVVVDDSGAVHIAPASWLERGFWERPNRETVQAELRIILNESD